jgi:hypothetical protein
METLRRVVGRNAVAAPSVSSANGISVSRFQAA